MAKKPAKPEFVCPACGGTETETVEWSGQIGSEGGDEYSGPWIECLACGLQGPELVWERMAKRRADIQRALGVSGDPSSNDRRYSDAIENFGYKMFRELKANDAEKGDFLAWKPSMAQAASELEHHFIKLSSALHRGKKHEITEHCADLANVVLAIDANLGAK